MREVSGTKFRYLEIDVMMLQAFYAHLPHLPGLFLPLLGVALLVLEGQFPSCPFSTCFKGHLDVYSLWN